MALLRPVNSLLATIDGFAIDCVLTEEHQLESEVTDYPVESGASIVDNVRPKPLIIRMECIVSNTPLPPLSTLRGPATSAAIPSEEALVRLQLIRDRREPVSIATSLRSWDNMILKDLTIPVSKDTGNALHFTATFQQVTIVSNTRSTRVAVPEAQSSSTSTKVCRASDLGNIAIDPTTSRWLDPKINEWRLSATPGTGAPPYSQVPEGHWILYRGKPDSVLDLFWRNMSVDQGHALEKRLADINVDKTPFADETFFDSTHVIVIPRSQAHIQDV